MCEIIQSIKFKMKKYLVFVIVIALFSCEGKKEILLPKADKTIVADVQEHSPIYIFFKVEGKDTIADVNRKNSIVSTNWIFNIDKRLPLRLIVPEIIKLEAKKDGSMHKNEAAENFFSYANDTKKSMAFLPFTKIKFVMEKPKSGIIVYFSKSNKILVNNIEVKKDSLANYLNNLPSDKPLKLNSCFDKNSSFDSYIRNQILIKSLEIEFLNPENFIY
jgi:biopolymer transport protein ExbD